LIDLGFRNESIRIFEEETILVVFAGAFIHTTQIHASARYPGAPRVPRYGMDRRPKLETTVGSVEGFGNDLIENFIHHAGNLLSLPMRRRMHAHTPGAREVINYNFAMVNECYG
jgi:hypothetical protein